ncbi:MAG: hypothetical protein WBV94_02755 [Blastocatellia bacterium]
MKQLRATELYNRFKGDAEFCEKSLSVLNKQGGLVPMQVNNAQKLLLATIKEIQESGRPVRIVILKSRRAGFSTGVAAKIFKHTPFRSGQKALVVAHDGKALKESLFPMYDRFQRNYKPFGNLIALPKLTSDRKDGFDWENEASISIQTAANTEGSRSFGFRLVHLSEFAFYDDARTLMTGLMQTVPSDSGTMVIVESTANGMGGPFWELWTKAVDPKNKSEWVPIFFPWFDDSDNWRALDVPADEFMNSLSEAERRLMRQFNLQLEQLNWRRWCIENNCDGSEKTFNQEYPDTWQNAFLVSGRPRFNIDAINRQEPEDGTVGELDQVEVGTRVELMFGPRKGGALTLWKKPSKFKQYIIGGDTSEGKDIKEGKGKADPDYSVAQVFEREMHEQVASLRERIQPAAFGDYLYDLGKWYNWAFLVVESNGVGRSTVDRLLYLGYPPDRLYRRRRSEKVGQTQTDEYGWLAGEISRNQLISKIDNAYNTNDIIVKCAVTLQESRTFVHKPNGKVEGNTDCHDDCVISLGLVIVGLLEAPIFAPAANERIVKPVQYQPTKREQLARERFGTGRNQDDDGWSDD